MQSILAIAFKDLKLLLRDRGGLFFTFFYPILFALFFGFIFQPSGTEIGALKVNVVDRDESQESKAFIELLKTAPELDITLTDSLQARKEVLAGKKIAYVILERGFGRARKNPFWGKAPVVLVGIDPSRKAEAGMLNGILMKYAVKDMQNVLSNTKHLRQLTSTALKSVKTDPDLPTYDKQILFDLFHSLNRFLGDSRLSSKGKNGSGFSGLEPLVIKEKNITISSLRQQNSFAFTFPQGIAWGLLACAISFAVSLVGERTRGTLFRIQAAAVKKSAVLAGKALASFITSMLMAVTLIIIGIFLFGIRVHSVPMLLLTLTVACIALVGIMVLFSVLGKTERAVSGMSWALVLPMMMLGGGMIPLAFMPKWLQTLSVISPVKWVLLSIEGSLWRAFSWSQIWQPLIFLLLMGTISFLIGVRRFSWD